MTAVITLRSGKWKSSVRIAKGGTGDRSQPTAAGVDCQSQSAFAKKSNFFFAFSGAIYV